MTATTTMNETDRVRVYDICIEDSLGPAARLVLIYFHAAGVPMSTDEVRIALGMSRTATYQHLKLLTAVGKLRKISHNRWEIVP